MAAYKGPKKDDLIRTIEEMNEVLGFNESQDPIPIEGEGGKPLSNQKLYDSIVNDAEAVEPEDKDDFSEVAWKVLTDIRPDLGTSSDAADDGEESGDDADNDPAEPVKEIKDRKKKTAKAPAAQPRKKKDLFENPGACTRIMMLIAENENLTNEEIGAVLEEENRNVAPGTLSLAASDARKMMRYLKRIDRLK